MGSVTNTTSRYSPVLQVLPEIKGVRKKVIFKTAGDGWLMLEYGEEQVFDLFDSFRLFVLSERIDREMNNIPGLLEYGFGFRTMMFRYDPRKIRARELLGYIKKIEDEIQTVEEISFKSRLVKLPIKFKDKVTTEAVKKYKEIIRKDSPNIINDHNFDYVAAYNGLTPDELKAKILNTEWILVHQLFYPGGTYQLPLDPRSLIEAPKYNPSRTYTPEGAVGLGGQCLYIYTTESPGGYQLLGRTVPTYQLAQKHEAFKSRPFLLQSTDRIKYVEIEEEKLLDIYKAVHEEGSPRYKYDISEGIFKVKDYINFLSDETVQRELREFEMKKAEAKKRIVVP